MLFENGEFERIRPHLTPLECGIIFDGIPEGAISSKVGLIWGIPAKYGYATATDIMTSDHNWQFVGKATETAPEMLVPRGKVTGGSSAINGQMFLRGVPEDYDSWASMGND